MTDKLVPGQCNKPFLHAVLSFFFKRQLLFSEMDHVIHINQSQLLFAKTNGDRCA